MWLLLAQITGQVLYLVGCVLLLRLAMRYRRQTYEALKARDEQHERLSQWLLAATNAHLALFDVVYEFAGRAGVLTDAERQAWEAKKAFARDTVDH